MRAHEDGSALILALLIVMALSIVGAALTVLALSETYGSMNYRLMMQARYAAESGVHKAANFLLNTYVVPGGADDPLATYDITTSPVKTNGAPVVLSSLTAVTPTYPVSSVQTAFQAATSGSLVTGNDNVAYSASATLLSMRSIFVYGTAAPVVIQTWQITGDGSTTGARTADVQVTATLERDVSPLYPFALFATNTGCGALSFSGGAVVNSYDSQNIQRDSNGNVISQLYGGNIGSNGNLNESGTQTTIYGNMSTPRTGVGSCSANGVDAWTQNGNAQVMGGLIKLPQAINYPTPDTPNPLPATTSIGLNKNSSCGTIVGCSAVSPSGFAFAPGSYGNVSLTGQAVVHLSSGVYTINSISLAGSAQIVIDSGPVVVKLAGLTSAGPPPAGSYLGTAADFTGGSITNATLNPANFQILYAGTGTIKLTGGTGSSAVAYAPNASVTISGGADFFGSIIAATITPSGGMQIHTDRQLPNNLFTVGNYMLSSFSWKKY